MALTKATRFSANIPIAGVAAGAVGSGLLIYAHSEQLGYAERLFEDGVIDEKAFNAYEEANDKIQAIMHADNSISTVDPTGASILLTVGAELQAKSMFEDWARENAPQLTQDQYETLSMSLFTENSEKTEMLLNASDLLKEHAQDDPQFASANNAREIYDVAARKVMYRSSDNANGRGRTNENDPVHKKLVEDMEAAETQLISELEVLFVSPDSVDTMLNMMPISDRLEYVRSLAQSEPDGALALINPEIDSYVKAYDDKFFASIRSFDEEEALEKNPDLVNEYIKSRSGYQIEDIAINISNESTVDIGAHSQPKDDSILPPVTAYHRISEEALPTGENSAEPQLKEGPWEAAINAVVVKEGDNIWNIVRNEFNIEDPAEIVERLKDIQDLNPGLELDLIHPDQVINLHVDELYADLSDDNISLIPAVEMGNQRPDSIEVNQDSSMQTKLNVQTLNV
jgi:hypothetical protein